MLAGPAWGPASKATPRQLVVLCHGFGSNGADIIHLANKLSAALPDALFVAPNGPDQCEMAPPGCRQWFSLQNRRAAAVSAGVRRAAAALGDFIDTTLAKHGLPPDAYALAGFSQGAVVSVFAGLRRAVPPQAILSYSGALIDAPSLATEMKNKAPVLLVHGMKDATVPPYASRTAEAVLREAGVPVESHMFAEVGHSIDAAGLAAGIAFLRQAFSGGASTKAAFASGPFAVDVAEP